MVWSKFEITVSKGKGSGWILKKKLRFGYMQRNFDLEPKDL